MTMSQTRRDRPQSVAPPMISVDTKLKTSIGVGSQLLHKHEVGSPSRA